MGATIWWPARARSFFPRLKHYAAVEECLAVKLGIHTFRVHLLGRKCVVVMDHRSLEWLQRMRGDNSRLTCWSLNLQPYQFEVQYRPGETNSNADRLSRMCSPRFNNNVIAGKRGGGVKDQLRPFPDDLCDARGPEIWWWTGEEETLLVMYLLLY